MAVLASAVLKWEAKENEYAMRCDAMRFREEWFGRLLYTYSSSFFGCSYILFFSF